MTDNTDLFPCELIDAQQAALDASKEEFKRLHAVIRNLIHVKDCAVDVAEKVELEGEAWIEIYASEYINLRQALDRCDGSKP